MPNPILMRRLRFGGGPSGPPAYWGVLSESGQAVVLDSFAPGQYDDGADVNETGIGYRWTEDVKWDGLWVARVTFLPQVGGMEDFDSYSTAIDLDGETGGSVWDSPWVARSNYVPAILGMDPFDSYTLASNLNGLNGGDEWAGAFVEKAG